MVKHLLLSVFSLIVLVVTVSAQSSVDQAARNARDRFSDIKNRSIELERMKRDANRRPTDENSTPKFPEIKEDFEQIQKLNSDVLNSYAAKTPTNYAVLLKSVSEINQRAARLKANLFTPVPAKNKEAEIQQQQNVESRNLPELLKSMDSRLNSFVHSSLFQNVNLVNSQDSINAQKDLDEVIKISSAIKETAKKLKKEAAKK